jgi:excisionase family DNA binding protein
MRSTTPQPLRPLATTISDASRISGIGAVTLYALIKEGKLKTTSIGRRRLVIYDSLEALLTSDSTQAA